MDFGALCIYRAAELLATDNVKRMTARDLLDYSLGTRLGMNYENWFVDSIPAEEVLEKMTMAVGNKVAVYFALGVQIQRKRKLRYPLWISHLKDIVSFIVNIACSVVDVHVSTIEPQGVNVNDIVYEQMECEMLTLFSDECTERPSRSTIPLKRLCYRLKNVVDKYDKLQVQTFQILQPHMHGVYESGTSPCALPADGNILDVIINCPYVKPHHSICCMCGLNFKQSHEAVTCFMKHLNEVMWVCAEGCLKPRYHSKYTGMEGWFVYSSTVLSQAVCHSRFKHKKDGRLIHVIVDKMVVRENRNGVLLIHPVFKNINTKDVISDAFSHAVYVQSESETVDEKLNEKEEEEVVIVDGESNEQTGFESEWSADDDVVWNEDFMASLFQDDVSVSETSEGISRVDGDLDDSAFFTDIFNTSIYY